MKRVTLFCGHYGSGKTNIAVNYALYLAEKGFETVIADLDIVNPYFRTKDSEKELTAAGIKVISPHFANSNVDLPSLPSEVYSVFQNKNIKAVLDVGGDDRGAYALGRYRDLILGENDYEMLYVVNFRRMLTQNAADALEVLREIEAVSLIPFTGIINNTNLGAESTAADVEKSFAEAEKLSQTAGIPLKGITAEKSIAEILSEKYEDVFPLTLQKNSDLRKLSDGGNYES